MRGGPARVLDALRRASGPSLSGATLFLAGAQDLAHISLALAHAGLLLGCQAELGDVDAGQGDGDDLRG